MLLRALFAELPNLNTPPKSVIVTGVFNVYFFISRNLLVHDFLYNFYNRNVVYMKPNTCIALLKIPKICGFGLKS